MNIDDLAARDAAGHIQNVRAALADERRGRALRAEQAGRTDCFDRNIARLEAELATLTETERNAA